MDTDSNMYDLVLCRDSLWQDALMQRCVTDWDFLTAFFRVPHNDREPLCSLAFFDKRAMRRRKNKTELAKAGTQNSAADSSFLSRQHSHSDSALASLNSDKSEQPEDILADSQLYKLEDRPFWKRKRFHFIIGVSVGVLAALGGISRTPVAQSHLNELQTYLALQLADIDIAGMLPATEMVDDLLGNVTNYFKPAPSSDVPFMPAAAVKDEMDLKPHFPVVLIPGIVSSGLESWGTAEKSQKYFRKRMWGTTTMFRSVLLDKESWTQHLRLDPVTGLDPPDIRIRAAQGLDAADYFVTGYWVWAKIIENLAAIGYDSNNMHLASYDWRLSFSNLEVRDKYFTKLKRTIEMSKATEDKKTVVVAHSMGSIVFSYFLKWVESPLGGNGGPRWTEDHIESFVNIAGPMVGVPKALTAMLSGETRDTIALGSFGAYLLEKFFSRKERASLMRTWAGGSSMLPMGGEVIWGTNDFAPDDPIDKPNHHSFGNMISFIDWEKPNDEGMTSLSDIIRNHTAATAMDLLHKSTTKEFRDQLRLNYSYGITTSKKQLKKNANDPTKWNNALESQLPNAPSMKIYCLYGINLPTERSYYYAQAEEESSSEHCNYDNCSDVDKNDTQGPELDKIAMDMAASLSSTAEKILRPPNLFINSNVHDPQNGVETGVRFSDGDGTVPVLSLGYMCTPSGGWTKHAHLYNPAHIPVVLKEYRHEESESKLDVRGGPKAGDHVDILGNWEMTLDILQIVSNKGYNVTQRIMSDIERYANNIHLPQETD